MAQTFHERMVCNIRPAQQRRGRANVAHLAYIIGEDGFRYSDKVVSGDLWGNRLPQLLAGPVVSEIQ